VLSQYEAKYSLCLNHLIIVTTVLKFYSSLISLFLQVMFTMLFFLILCMKLSYFFSSLKILSVLSALYHKCSFFFMFKASHKSLNFHSQNLNCCWLDIILLYYHELIFIALQYDTWLIFSLWCRMRSLAKSLLLTNSSIISQRFILCVQFD